MTVAEKIITTSTIPSLERLQKLVGEDMTQVNDVIINSISQDVGMIVDIGRHIISSGGKRLRPSMTIVCAKLCGYKSGNRHISLAAAVELIHTATLLHDDVVDESTMRRGDQTANDIWSNQASVLVGDFLLSRAFQLMVADGSLEVLKILSDASATISQGEVKQLMIAGDPSVDFSDYLQVIEAKTATLFASATEIGAVITNRNDVKQELRDFGLYLGVAFQLVDDALDYAASQEKLGKTVGDDFREGKITLPVILAYQNGNAEERNFWKNVMSGDEQSTADFKKAQSLIEKYNSINRTLDKAKDYCLKAENMLTQFPNSEEKQSLIDTLSFCIGREF